MHALLAKLRALLRRRNLEAEMAEEIRQHLEHRIQEKIADGLAPDAARYAAQREFGGIAQVQERCRDERRFTWVEHSWQDLRHAVRQLRRNSGFTFVAVLTLALGIGANTAIFSLVHALILRPLPFPQPEQLVLVWRNSAREAPADGLASWPVFSDWRTQNTTFASMAGYSISNVSFTGSGEPEQLPAVYAGDRFFETLGVQPVLGRWFRDEEQIRGKETEVVILSHGLWLRRFGADPAVLGKDIQVNQRPRTVVGVMPAGFAFPARTDLYLPLAPDDRVRALRSATFVFMLGRLKPGVPIVQAQIDLAAITSNIERQFPKEQGFVAQVIGMHAWTVRNVHTALWVLLGAVGCVLLIACANLASLLLARGIARRREIAVRVALGASRARIIGALLIESLVLAFAGGGLGLLFGKWAVDTIKAFAAATLPQHTLIGIDSVVLAVTAVVCVLCGLGFGLVPAWLASRTDPHEALKEGARGQSATRSAQIARGALVVAQTALAVVLLIGAGLLLRSFWKLSEVNTGLRGDQLVAMPLAPVGNNYSGSGLVAFQQTLMERLAALPGVQSAGLTTNILLQGIDTGSNFTIEGRPNPPAEHRLRLPLDSVSPDYFATMGVPLVAGRAFNAGDVQGAPRVAIVNETMARLFWPDQSAVGRRFLFGDLPVPDAKGERRAPDWITIVGVVRDTRRQGPDRPIRIECWKPLAQPPTFNRFHAVVRTSLPAPAIARSLRAAVWSIDKDLPVPRVEAVAELLDAGIRQRRLNLWLLAAFAALALLLAALGLYGVMAYSVNQRTGEFGIRFALGAQPGDVLRLVLSQASRLISLGLALGLLGALVLGRVVETLLFDIKAHDALTYVGVAVLLALVALFAAWLPARRAARVDPMTALRCD